MDISGILLSESIKRNKIDWDINLYIASNIIGETITNCKKFLMKNNGFNVLKNISAILDG